MNKHVFVTGCGRGIGRTIALELANAGYVVSGCSRSLTELESVKAESGNKIRIASVDVSKYDDLEKWINGELQASQATPWGLVTAAGVYGPIGTFTENNWEDWKKALEINLYGTLMATKIFTKILLSKKIPGRITLLSGGGATKPMPNFTSYCVNKSGVVRFGETLALELLNSGITVNSIAPGAINTKFTDQVLAAGPEKAGVEMYESALKQKQGKSSDPKKAAELVCYLMSDKASNVTGRLISAIWDNWSEMHSWNEKRQKSDLFTLRRVVPEDRPGL